MLGEIFLGGWKGLLDYLSFHVLTCLVPAFFIAGAIVVFVSQGTVRKYLGPSAKKAVAYLAASVGGFILAVCSCTILPIFAGIYKRGAGIGPATTFLYSGPAINVMAVVYSARLLGYDIGAVRAVGAIIGSILIGWIMSVIFRKDDVLRDESMFNNYDEAPTVKSTGVVLCLLGSLFAILVSATQKWWIVLGISFAVLLIILIMKFSRDDLKAWMMETWGFVKRIFPLLILGVFLAGMLKVIIPEQWVSTLVGSNTIPANFIASVAGVFLYTSTLTEVPIIKAFMDLGMATGPVVAVLLAGPSLSLPSILGIKQVLGWKRTWSYVGIVALFGTISGLLFGSFVR